MTEAFREAVRATRESEWKPLIRWIDGSNRPVRNGRRSPICPTEPDIVGSRPTTASWRSANRCSRCRWRHMATHTQTSNCSSSILDEAFCDHPTARRGDLMSLPGAIHDAAPALRHEHRLYFVRAELVGEATVHAGNGEPDAWPLVLQ